MESVEDGADDDETDQAAEEKKGLEYDELINSDFLRGLVGKSGVYFVSPDTPETEGREDGAFLVKVGLSRHSKHGNAPPHGGLGRRLSSYFLCWPRGFYVYAVVQTRRAAAFECERTFHSYFRAKQYELRAAHSHREEWAFLTLQDIQVACDAHSVRHPGDTVTVYTEPLFIDSNGRTSARPVRAMSEEKKREFEAGMTPRRVPATGARDVRSVGLTRDENFNPIPMSALAEEGEDDDEEPVDEREMRKRRREAKRE